jgi:hypothetical protein
MTTTKTTTKPGKIVKALCGALAAAALFTAVAPQSAEAGWRHRHGWGVGAGILGGIAAGALIAGAASAHPGYYAAPVYSGPDCYWVRQRRETWDGYVVVRRVRVCE